jgi:hypothetical protein
MNDSGTTAVARPAVKLKPGRSRPILRRTTYERRLMQEFSAGTIIVVIPVRRLDVRASKNGSCRGYDQPPRDTEPT